MMKIVKIEGRELVSVVLNGNELLELLPVELQEIIQENEEIIMDDIGLGVFNKYVFTAPIYEIEDTPESIKFVIGI